MEVLALNNQSESFLSLALTDKSPLVTVCLNLVPPGVVGACRGDLPTVRCVLDLLFGRWICDGFLSVTREEDRERIDGVVGAERPSMYDT